MGFESTFSAPQLTPAQWKQIQTCFEHNEAFSKLNIIDNESTVFYAFKTTCRESWPQDFSVALEPYGVYLCFHAATDQQQQAVTSLLTECLNRVGLTGEFEEL